MCVILISPRHQRGVKSAQSNTKRSAISGWSAISAQPWKANAGVRRAVRFVRQGWANGELRPKTRGFPPRHRSRLLIQPGADAVAPGTGIRDCSRAPAPSCSRASLRFCLCRTGSPPFVSSSPPADQGLIAILSDWWNQEAETCEEALQVEESSEGGATFMKSKFTAFL